MSDLVGIGLIAAVKHGAKRWCPVRLAQARPHGIALGDLTLHVAVIFAVAADITRLGSRIRQPASS